MREISGGKDPRVGGGGRKLAREPWKKRYEECVFERRQGEWQHEVIDSSHETSRAKRFLKEVLRKSY